MTEPAGWSEYERLLGRIQARARSERINASRHLDRMGQDGDRAHYQRYAVAAAQANALEWVLAEAAIISEDAARAQEGART